MDRCFYSIDCLLALENKEVDFCQVNVEEVLIAQSHVTGVSIVGEKRDEIGA